MKTKIHLWPPPHQKNAKYTAAVMQSLLSTWLIVIFVFHSWISCGCQGQGVRSPNKRGGTLQSLPHFHSADMISWQQWPLLMIRHSRSVAFHNRRACKTRWPHFPLPVQGSYPPHEKAFHHKPRQPLLNRIYKYFTEAERSGGDTSDKSVNHVPLHLSYPFLQSVCKWTQHASKPFFKHPILLEDANH